MDLLSYFAVPPEASLENDITHLGKQLEVAQVLHDNPVVMEYLKNQIDQLTSSVMNSASVTASAEAARIHLVQCQNQIRAYDHLYGLAANIVELRNSYTALTTQGNNQ